MKKLSEEQKNYLTKVASASDQSYEVVFEGMRKVAEKLEEMDPSTADAHLLSVIKAASELLVAGETPVLAGIGKEILASLDEYKSFLEKYKNVNYEGKSVDGDHPEMMPDTLFTA